MGSDSDSKLGAGFWLAVIGLGVGAVIAAAVMFKVFGWVWYTWGLLGAFLLFTLIAVGVGWVFDRREQRKRLAA